MYSEVLHYYVHNKTNPTQTREGRARRILIKTKIISPAPTQNRAYQHRHTPQIGSTTHWAKTRHTGSIATHSCVFPLQCVGDDAACVSRIGGAPVQIYIPTLGAHCCHQRGGQRRWTQRVMVISKHKR